MTTLEALTWGFGLLEGPRADEKGNVYFADVTNGGVYCRRVNGVIDTVIPRRRGVGGIALHRSGGIVVSGRNIGHVRDGVTRIIFEPIAPGLNDLFTDSRGSVICATLGSDPLPIEGRHVPGDCWRIDADAPGGVRFLYGDIGITNGIGFSPDQRTLYHADTEAGGVIAHTYHSDGSVTDRRFLVQRDDLRPDGLAVDEQGVVWVADVSGSGAVRGFSPEGAEVGRVNVPARTVTSLCFGGPERRDIFVVTADNTDRPDRNGTIYHGRVDVPGCLVTPAAV